MATTMDNQKACTNMDLRLVGTAASPYTRKMRAVLRFRRIPYRFVIKGSREQKKLPSSPLPIVPCVIFPGGDGEPTDPMSDSTPIINRLEKEFKFRQLRPKDPALAFIDALLEEFGDEWLAKCMFHYRWSNATDTQTSSSYLVYNRNITASPADATAMAEIFAQRQISRIGVVGSNKTTGPIIEESWKRFLEIFDKHLQNQPFFLGHRPGAGDFGCFGQMTMLVMTDPTPMAIARRISPRSFAWTEAMEDHSGIDVDESDWINLDAPPPTLLDLLTEVGRLFVPFLLENAAAVERGNKMLECRIDGKPWVQEAFVYQAKCLRWLKERYNILSTGDQARLDKILSDTGCDVLFK